MKQYSNIDKICVRYKQKKMVWFCHFDCTQGLTNQIGKIILILKTDLFPKNNCPRHIECKLYFQNSYFYLFVTNDYFIRHLKLYRSDILYVDFVHLIDQANLKGRRFLEPKHELKYAVRPAVRCSRIE